MAPFDSSLVRTTFLRRLSLFLVALALAVFAASALAGSFFANSSITGSDPAFANPPIGNSPSTCGAATPAPAPRSGIFHYETYTFRNISQASQCVNVSLAVSSGWATASVYLGSFDPSNPATNFYGGFGLPGYITQAGSADGFSVDVTCFKCSATIPETFVVVVSEGFANNDATYTLLVEGTGIIMTGGGPTATSSLQSFRASSAPKGVVVRWRTRSELKTLGFNVYRGGRKKVRLTRSLVRASGNGLGHTYSVLDRNVRSKNHAPYYLEVVDRSGSKIMFGPALTAAR